MTIQKHWKNKKGNCLLIFPSRVPFYCGSDSGWDIKAIVLWSASILDCDVGRKSDMTHSDRRTTMRNFHSKDYSESSISHMLKHTLVLLFCIFDINLHFLCCTHADTDIHICSAMTMKTSNNKTSLALMRRVIKKVHKLRLHCTMCTHTHRRRIKLLSYAIFTQKKVLT